MPLIAVIIGFLIECYKKIQKLATAYVNFRASTELKHPHKIIRK